MAPKKKKIVPDNDEVDASSSTATSTPVRGNLRKRFQSQVEGIEEVVKEFSVKLKREVCFRLKLVTAKY